MLLRNAKLPIVLFWLLGAANGQTQKFTCATCHVSEATSQPATPMGRALLVSGQNSTFKAHGKLNVKRGKFTYLVETQGDVSTYNVTDGERTISIPIQWTFGAGAQTFVLIRNKDFLESMVSYYPEIGGLDVTIGDNDLTPQNLEEAVGRKLTISEVTSCFGCHSTHSVSGHKLDLASLSPGVKCERCHVEAPTHLAAMSRASGATELKRTMPEQLGKRSSESISNFCGQCHRSWETVVRSDWRSEVNVRFQPYRLANSKCFDGTDNRIRCLSCHNPHQDLIKDDTLYDAKCLACHASGTTHNPSMRATGTNNASPPTAKACPVSDRQCVSCHMPKVALPGGHQTFTDHDIRIVKPGEQYPN